MDIVKNTPRNFTSRSADVNHDNKQNNSNRNITNPKGKNTTDKNMLEMSSRDHTPQKNNDDNKNAKSNLKHLMPIYSDRNKTQSNGIKQQNGTITKPQISNQNVVSKIKPNIKYDPIVNNNNEDEQDIEMEIRIQKLKNSKDQGKSTPVFYFSIFGIVFITNLLGWYFFYKYYINNYNNILEHLKEVSTIPNDLKVIFLATYESLARYTYPLLINSKAFLYNI